MAKENNVLLFLFSFNHGRHSSPCTLSPAAPEHRHPPKPHKTLTHPSEQEKKAYPYPKIQEGTSSLNMHATPGPGHTPV